MSNERIYTENKESVMNLKRNTGLNDIIISFDEKPVGLKAVCKDGTTIPAKEVIKYINSIVNNNIIKSVKEILSNTRYTRTIASYSNTIRDNVIPIKLSYPNNDLSSNRWRGYFINLDNGNIYHIHAGMQKHSKYRYEFHTVYLDESITKHVNSKLIFDTLTD